MPPMGFEPMISAGERPQTYDLDRAATGTGLVFTYTPYFQQSAHDICARSNKKNREMNLLTQWQNEKF